MKLKRGIAVLLPVLGIAAVGAVGAQVITEGADTRLLDEQQAASEASAADMISPPVEMTTTEVTTTETIVVAPEPVALPEPLAVTLPVPVRAERVVIDLPRSVSARSGEGSGEEIAIRTAPVDERAGLSPLYQVDQSPGV